MFKAIIITAAMGLSILSAATSHAAPHADVPQTLSLPVADHVQTIDDQAAYETAYYCEWVTVYDYWGNWVTLWQCY